MARFRPKGLGLERVLGTGALFSTAYGNVGSSIYYALGLVAAFALGMTPVVYLIAGGLFVMTAMTYAEAATNFPEAGGSSSFARRAFNELVSFFAAWGQMLNYIITVAISAFFVPHYLAVFWEPLGESPGDVIGGIVIVVLLSAINIVGVTESARLNFLLAVIDFATQLLLLLLGVFLVLNFGTLIDNIHLWTAPTVGDFVLSITIAMISYTGIETISNLAEEAREPRKLIPRAMALVVLAVMVIYAGLPAVALSALPVTQTADGYTTELATTYAGDPILGIVENMNLGFLQTAAEYYVGVLAATILVIASNAGIFGVSRLTYSMGQYQQLPDGLRRISPRFRTPAVAIGVFGAIACIVMIPGQADFLATLYAFGAMLSFTIAHGALVVLRWRLARSRMRKLPGDVEVEREEAWYRAPLNVRVHGVDIPIFAVVGGLGTFAAWIAVMSLYTTTLFVGMGWMAVGLVSYYAYRKRKGLPLAETSKVKLPPVVGAEPVRYAAVLVAFEEGTYSEDAMATALKLASHRGGDVRVITTITVPQHLDINAELPQAEATAQAVIEAARQWAARGQRVRGRIAKVRPDEAGHRIVREAVDARSQAIVMPMPERRPSGKLLSKTLEVVLAKRPCRVIVDSVPAKPLRERRPARDRAAV
ncbi:MAG TPA: universal stress protein [Solirubrobacterales bacterium]|nr:universal stress protein [Solirubrobacterales bacterium]